MRRRRRQAGFTVLEVTAAFLIFGLLATPLLFTQLNQARNRLTESTATDILNLGEAAQNFRGETGAWPDQANNCAGAIATMSAAGYLGNNNTNSPWNTAYVTTCPANLRFDVATTAPAQRDAEAVQRAGPRGTRAGNTVTASFARPGVEPSFDQLLHREQIAGRPELNRMQTGIDMNGNNVSAIGQLQWNNGVSIRSTAANQLDLTANVANLNGVMVASDVVSTAMGKSMSQAVLELDVIDSGDAVTLPTCPGGLTPRLFAWPHDAVSSAVAPPMHAFRIRTQFVSGSTYRVFLQVATSTSGGFVDASNLSRLVVAPKCG
jgi:type II secretory pathway pseudopilin PulG